MRRLNIIYNGDGLKQLSNKIIFPNNSIDLILTSPSYADKRRDSYGGVTTRNYVKWFLGISKDYTES